MEGQTSIKSLAERNLREIASALDEFEKSTSEEYWRLLVDQLPRGSFQRWEVERFAAAALQDHSPSLLLLEVVQQRQLVSTIEDLVIALERIGCHRAVNALTLKSKVIITQQPVQCLVLQGGNIQLYCEAECKPQGPLYQWFISQVGEGGVERTLPLKGATDKQLIVQRAEVTHHGKYCCRCTNPYMAEREEGRVAFSNWAMVTVAGVPVILKEPDPIQDVHIGQHLVLSVHAECHPAPPEYRWFRVSPGKETLQLEGHKEAVLEFRICTFDDAGEYFCVVGNPLLSDKQEGWRSSTVTVVRVLPPRVEVQPLSPDYGVVQDEGTENGDEGRFSYGPEPQQPESQTNSEHGLNLLGTDMQRRGYPNIARSPVGPQPDQLRPENLPLRFPEDQQSIVGGQSTHEYPSGGENVKEMTQPLSTVCGGPLPTPATEEGNIIFSCQPQDISVLVRQPFTVHCKAETGSGKLLYQLFERKGNGECSPITGMSSKKDIVVEGRSRPYPKVSLFVRAFKESDRSVYQDSVHFEVQLKKAMFVAQPLSSVKGITGKDVMLMCRLASSDERPPKVSYQWYRGERRNSNDFKFLPDQKCNILHLSKLGPNDTGYYGCKVCVEGERSDMYYSDETYLTVGNEEDGDIVITEHPSPVTPVAVKSGSEFQLYACAMSTVGEPLRFVWQKNGHPLPSEGATLVIKSATEADSGSYRCVVMAANGGQKRETNAVRVPTHPASVSIHRKAETYVRGKLRGKVALLIANQDYKNFPKLQTAEEDVKKLAVKLRRLGFNVLTLANLTLREMQEAQDIFCNHLLSEDATGVLAFVYFAGHGFLTPHDSTEYLMPVDAVGLNQMTNINRDSFCLSLRSGPKCAKLFRITDCCRTLVSDENDTQSSMRPHSSLQRQSDYYNFIDVKGCGYSRLAAESFLAEILQGLMADHNLTLLELTNMIQEKAMQNDQITIQRPQVTPNMSRWGQMKLSDEIDVSAYAEFVANPAPDQRCVENWKKLDPSDLPKDYVLPLSNADLRGKAVVKLTLEEVFSNVVRVTVCAQRRGTGTYHLTVNIDKEELRKQGKGEIEVCDKEPSTGSEQSVVVRNIQRLKGPLMLSIDVCMTDGPNRQEERLAYTAPVGLLYAALKPS